MEIEIQTHFWSLWIADIPWGGSHAVYSLRNCTTICQIVFDVKRQLQLLFERYSVVQICTQFIEFNIISRFVYKSSGVVWMESQSIGIYGRVRKIQTSIEWEIVCGDTSDFENAGCVHRIDDIMPGIATEMEVLFAAFDFEQNWRNVFDLIVNFKYNLSEIVTANHIIERQSERVLTHFAAQIITFGV